MEENGMLSAGRRLMAVRQKLYKKRKQGLTARLPAWYNKMLLYPEIKRAWFPML